jgi:UDP-N-acetylmuramoylalanine-D-glutamate ligase
MFVYKNKKIFILGMAKSGYEVAKLLASDNNIFITDMKEQNIDQVRELEELGVTFKILNNLTNTIFITQKR